jgi:hypothetical protein
MAASPSSTVAAETSSRGVVEAPASATIVGSSLARGGSDSVLRSWGRVSEETTRALNTRCFKGPRLSTPMSACLREDGRQRQQTSQKKHRKEKLKLETYILERTRALFTGRSDEPCSGAARFEPVVSGAAPLRTAATPVAAFSPICSGLTPRPPRRSGSDRGPRRRQETHEHLGLHRPG